MSEQLHTIDVMIVIEEDENIKEMIAPFEVTLDRIEDIDLKHGPLPVYWLTGTKDNLVALMQFWGFEDGDITEYFN